MAFPHRGRVAVLLVSCIVTAACAGPTPKDREAAAPSTSLQVSQPSPPPGLEYIPPPPGSYALPPIQPAVDGAVIDTDGTPRRLFDYLGDRYVLLSFVYTRCTDTEGCPLATGILEMVAEELKTDATLASAVRLVTLSFDPERDTPEVMRRYALHAGGEYAKIPWNRRPWVFLAAPSAAALRPVLEGYGQSIVREIDATGKPTGNFSHVLKVYLIDRKRRVRNIYSTSFLHPATAINDLKTLVMEDAS
ncbi:MAG TPA: SCO family protein [Candidatus Polarisedimenticolia bacterium]|nr:SCO family protein [Candidatus Polarisedimenticolia bacterium]